MNWINCEIEKREKEIEKIENIIEDLEDEIRIAWVEKDKDKEIRLSLERDYIINYDLSRLFREIGELLDERETGIQFEFENWDRLYNDRKELDIMVEERMR